MYMYVHTGGFTISMSSYIIQLFLHDVNVLLGFHVPCVRDVFSKCCYYIVTNETELGSHTFHDS